MTDFETANFDDELLSAYLDDELTPDERARVEAHLAVDPRVRQLLDELRAVSREMKVIPPATLGSDLRDTVLRRAERTMLLPGEGALSHGLNDWARKLPFGRSKRAWAWAGMALAAGLLLMFFEREPERNQGLPGAVARRERSLPLEARSRSESADRADVREKVDELVTNQAVAPVSAPTAAPTAGTAAVAVRDHGEIGGEVSGGLRGSAAVVGQSVAGAENGDDLLVVHVNVKPAALRSRAIDAVLARNQIDVEPPAESEMDKTKFAYALPAAQDVDVLLLEAAPAQIMSTLAELDADHANYLGITVDDQLAASQRARAAAQSEYDFKQYNRGTAPAQQKLEVASNRNWYVETERGPVEIEFQQQATNGGESSGSVQSRALRIVPQAAELKDSPVQILAKESREQSSATIPPPASSEPADGYARANSSLVRRANQKLAVKAEMLQVLFVLTASEEPAPAKPFATPPPSTSQPVEEGLKKNDR